MSRPTRSHGLIKNAAGRGADYAAYTSIGKRGRYLVCRHETQPISFFDIEGAELGLADTRGVFQHSLEHRLQIAGRTTDNLEHL